MICDECGLEGGHDLFCVEGIDPVPDEEALADADPGLLL